MVERPGAGVPAASRPSARAAGFAVAAVTLGLAGHVAAGAPPPDVVTVVASTVLVAVGYRVVLAARERSWPALAALLGAVQLLLHWLFTVGARTGDGGPMAMPDGLSMTHAAAHGGTAPGSAMVVAHLAAALVLGWFLRQGEQALWAAARRLVAQRWAARWAARWTRARRALRPVPVTPPALTTTAPAASVRSWTPPRITGLGGRRADGGRSWRAPPAPSVLAA